MGPRGPESKGFLLATKQVVGGGRDHHLKHPARGFLGSITVEELALCFRASLGTPQIVLQIRFAFPTECESLIQKQEILNASKERNNKKKKKPRRMGSS